MSIPPQPPVEPGRVPRRRLPRLTYANVTSTIALVAALSGGAAYAATALPAGSVGTSQLQRNAVTVTRIAPAAVDSRQIAADAVIGAKLADGAVDTAQLSTGAVTLNRLSGGVQRRILDVPERGPAGPVGPAGAAGPAGPGAARLRLAEAATADAAPRTILDVPGMRMSGACVAHDGQVGMNLSLAPAEDTTINESVLIDQGDDIAAGGQTQGAQNLAISLPGGAPVEVGGPSVETGYVRVIANLVMAMQSRTITAQIVLIVDATAGRCSVDGTAVTAS